MSAIGTLGMNAANAAVGGIMGIAFGKQQDRRQIEQQKKLQAMQIAGQQQMVDYNYGKQMQMWKDTNYGAQMNQLNEAGLNPALLYGMGGGGGTTTGQATGNVEGGKAPTGGGEPLAMGISMMQAQLMKAQKENIEAQTQKIKGETGNIPLTGENIKADTGLKGQQKLKTNEERDSIAYDNIIKELLVNRDEKGNLVEDDKNRLAFKQQAANYLKSTLEQANIDANTQKQIAEIAQKWQGLKLQERQVALNEALGKAGLDNKDQDQLINIISMIINNLTHGIISIKRKPQQRIDNSYRPTEIYNQ